MNVVAFVGIIAIFIMVGMVVMTYFNTQEKISHLPWVDEKTLIDSKETIIGHCQLMVENGFSSPTRNCIAEADRIHPTVTAPSELK